MCVCVRACVRACVRVRVRVRARGRARARARACACVCLNHIHNLLLVNDRVFSFAFSKLNYDYN